MASIVWQHSVQPKGYLENFSVHHNYALCYQKTNEFSLNALTRTEEHNKHYSNPDNDPKGPWRSGDVRNALYRPNLIFDLVSPSGKVIKPPKNGWRWSKETIERKIQSGEIIFNKDETGIVRKIYLASVEGRAPETIWFGKEVGTTREATEELKELFKGNTPFDTPKPSRLVQQMLQIGTEAESDDIIIDFFAGSGTTAQAVMQLNKEDGGNRKFILVQLPEKTDEESEAYKAGYKTIADICKERIRRVCKRIEEDEAKQNPLFRQGGTVPLAKGDNRGSDLGFKVFTLEPSNFKVWRTDVIESEEDLKRQMEAFVDPTRARSEADDPDAVGAGMAWEILIKSGYELTTPLEKIYLPKLGGPKDSPLARSSAKNTADKSTPDHQSETVPVYSIGNGEVIVALEKITQEAIDAIIAKRPKRVVCLDRLFASNDQLKTNTALQMKDAGVEFGTI